MILSTHLFCLLNLSTTPQLCPPLLLSYTFDVLDHIHQHKQPNTIRYLLCAIYYALCTMHYLLCTMHYALCVIHYALCTMHYALFTMHYALCIYTMHYLLCTMYTYLYVFIRIYYFIRIYTYSYVFIISHGNPAKSSDFGTHAKLSSRRVTLPTGPKSAYH